MYILQISTHIFYCIRCILQFSTYVLCVHNNVFTIAIGRILSVKSVNLSRERIQLIIVVVRLQERTLSILSC